MFPPAQGSDLAVKKLGRTEWAMTDSGMTYETIASSFTAIDMTGERGYHAGRFRF